MTMSTMNTVAISTKENDSYMNNNIRFLLHFSLLKGREYTEF